MAAVCRYQGVISLRIGSPKVRRLKLPGDWDTVGAATFSTDGNVVAASGIGGVLAVDLLPQPKLSPAELDSRGDEIMALDNTGRRFAVARRRTVEIWGRQKGQRSFILEAPRREMFSALLFSRNGKVLAAGAGDRAIMLWDVGTRESLAPPMNGPRRSSSGLSFSNDGNLLVSASKDGVVVWDLHPESLVSHACGTANRQFDEVEWRRVSKTSTGQPAKLLTFEVSDRYNQFS